MLAERLKKMREECGFTQENVAKALGINRTTYTYYETGKHEPKLETLKKLARMFNTDVGTLVDGIPSASYNEPITLHDDSFKNLLDKSDYKRMSALSDDERVLLLYYRQLDNDDKSYLINGIKGKISD